MNKSTLSLTVFFVLSVFFSFTISNTEKSDNQKFSIAPQEYEQLAEKSLRHIEKYEFSELYKMVSDDIEYYLPNGGEVSRTKFIGKKEFMGFWDSYVEKSGNNLMTMTNTVHVPLISHNELNYSKISGVIVLSYFSLDMTFGDETIDMRMNWGFHFNEDKKIDKIYSYYDRTPIIEAAKRNILSNKE